jgi:hypothetical protein
MMSSDFIRRKQQSIPPTEMLNDIERNVMGTIDALPSARSMRSRNRNRIASGIAAAAIIMATLYAVRKPETELTLNQDFTESRILQPHLTSIWLSPVQTVNTKQVAGDE